jgi:hypothetical protein
MAVDRSPVDTTRAAFTTARNARLAAQADLVKKNVAVAALARSAPPNDPALASAKSAAQAQQDAVSAARAAEKTALTNVTAVLGQWLLEDPAADVTRLEGRFPIVLMPVRVETRFVPESSELRVRVYPDEITSDAHEPELSQTEQTAGQAYWAAASGGQESLAAWQVLLATYPPERAAWIVQQTGPNATQPQTFTKPSGWSRAVEARLLPDRFVVIATRGTVTKRAVGLPITEPLALTVGPDTLDSDQTQIGPDGTFKLDDAVKWTIDFSTAVSVGMGIRLPVDAEDLRLGFDRVIVIGVKTSMDAPSTALALGALFDAHHYTRGLAFVKQGTPTSNALGTPAGFPVSDPNGARSFAIERGAALGTASDSAAATLSDALGLPRGLFTHVDGADLSEVTPARKMNRVLYSATLGYYLDQMMSPLLTSDAVNQVGVHFATWVVPRGICSAFRVGRVPYGVLPVTSLTKWQDADNATPVAQRMSALFKQIVPIWSRFAILAPHVGRSGDPDQDLLDVLAMDASARQARVRRVLGDGAYLNMAQMFNWPVAAWESYHKWVGAAALAAIGVTAPTPPRVVSLNFLDQSRPYDGPLVDTLPISETDPLGPRDYITWAQKASVADLHAEQFPASIPVDVKRALLYRFLRHGTLAEYHVWAGLLLATHATITPAAAFREPELVGIVNGTESRPTPWQRFAMQINVPTIGVIGIEQFLDGDFESELRALTGVGDYRDALAALAPLPTAELERLFTESLDAVSYRVDAWVTSLANQRLAQMRSRLERTPGCFVGSYAWVENLRPDTTTTVTLPDGRVARTTPGGYVHAPSMTHATTAAVLRNAYLTHLGDTASPYAIDLSSAQVRMGRFVLDSVRNGQPVGAVLGYLLERAFHDDHAESLIDPVRQVAPLVANKTEDSSEPAETISARNVVDGLVLRDKWKANKLFDVPGGLPGTIAHRDVLERELGVLDRHIDAVADLLLAESVHQIVRGSTMASGAGLDALAQGTRPPDPDVGRGVTGGTTLTHRLAVVLGATPPALPLGWSAVTTPRAACEPRLDAWIATLLGDPRTARCRVTYPTNASTTLTVNVTFDQLALHPLDVLSIAKAVTTDPAASDLDRRVLFAAFGDSVPADAAAGGSFTIVYEADPSWDRATTRAIPELLDVANAASRALGGMRALGAVDLVLPENASVAKDAVPDATEANTRAQAALSALTQVQTDLAAAITAANVDGMRKQMRVASAFGIAAAFPGLPAGAQEGGVNALSLADQARSVLADVAARLDTASRVTVGDAEALAEAVFGREFRLVAGFTFPGPGGAELAQAIANGPAIVGGDVSVVDRFVTQVMRVREPLARWRLMRILAEAGGAAPATFTIAQLPNDSNASWVALPPKPDEHRLSGKLSLALHAPGGAIDTSRTIFGLFLDEWVESIPNEREHTGIAFRHEDTAGEATQTILVAVPPTMTATWDLDSLEAIVNETLDLAKLRAVDLELIDPLAQLAPTIFLAANAGDDTISSVLKTKFDATIVAVGGAS